MVPTYHHASRWRAYLAGSVLVLLVGLELSYAWNLGGRDGSQPTQQVTNKPPTPYRPFTADEPAAPIDAYSCVHPQSAQQQSLCIARDAAQATEKQVGWTTATVYIGVAGTVALILTLYYTRQSARSSGGSAQAARAAVAQAASVAEYQLRAYVTLEELKVEEVKDVSGNRIRIELTPVWSNSGATPALRVEFCTISRLTQYSDFPDDFDFDNSGLKGGNVSVIGPNAKANGPTALPIEESGINSFVWKVTSLIVYGAVSYTDVFFKKRRTEFSGSIRIGHDAGEKPFAYFTKSRRHNGVDQDCLRDPYANAGAALKQS